MQVKDLKIDTEIFALFNFTWNEDAALKVRKLINTPLHTKQEIIARQDIIKGFLANISLFKNYSYSRIDYREASQFMANYTDKEFLPKRLSTKLLVSKKLYHIYRSHCVQVILLFHRLHNLYIKNLTTAIFPESYKTDLKNLNDLFNSLRLDHYETLIRSDKFKIKAIVQFIKLISAQYKQDKIKTFLDQFTTFEAYISIAIGAYNNQFSFPELTDNELSITEFYHPLLPNPVKNSFTSGTNVILLTGPNMSGKSTLLKAVSLCVYLANTGFPIPAKMGRIPRYDNISVYINLNDDLQSGYSHFMTEIINLKQVITAANSLQCFAVFDELFRGTNIDDALEISRTTLQGMLNFKSSTFFVSSHLHQLVTLPEIMNGRIMCQYLNCDLNGDIPAFTYQLK